MLAGLLAGIRVAVLPHTADVRQLKTALIAVRPTFVFCSSSASAVVKLVPRSDWPELQQFLVYGDEFLGRSLLGSFNVFVRDSRVPNVDRDSYAQAPLAALPPGGRKGGAADEAAVVTFTWDAIGRYREITLTPAALWERLERDGGGREGALLLSEVEGLVVNVEVVVRLLQHVFGDEVVAKL